jgi:hypothetical protein
MAHRAISLRYRLAKVSAGFEEFLTQIQSSASTSISEAIVKGFERFHRQMAGVGLITGAAMAPTLNASAVTQSDAVD